MWQRIIAENLCEVLILEDDVMIGEMLIRVLGARHQLPADFDMINLMTDVNQIPFGQPVCDIYRVCRFEGYANRTGAYLITRRGAEKLLSQAYPIRWPADGLTGRTYITSLISYGIEPRLLSLHHFESEIWGNENFTNLRSTFRAKSQKTMRRFFEGLISLCYGNHELPR